MLGVAVRGIRTGEHIRLSRARGHAGGRAAALNVVDDDRDLGEIGQPQKLVHQRDARPRRRGERARAVPGRADGHADGRQFILSLHYAVQALALIGDAEFFGVLLEPFGNRRGRRNRIPGAYGGAGINGTQPGRFVAGHHDLALGGRCVSHLHWQRAVEVIHGELAAQRHRLHVGRDQLFFALELIGDHDFQHLQVHIQQRRQRTDVNHILEQLALAHIRPFRRANLGNRDGQDGDVVARPVAGTGAIVKEPAASNDLAQVLVVGLRVHGDHQVDALAPRRVAGLRDTHFVPGRQPLDVGGEDVLGRHGNAHAEQRLCEHGVRARRPRAIHGRELHDEIVDTAHAGSSPFSLLPVLAGLAAGFM